MNEWTSWWERFCQGLCTNFTLWWILQSDWAPRFWETSGLSIRQLNYSTLINIHYAINADNLFVFYVYGNLLEKRYLSGTRTIDGWMNELRMGRLHGLVDGVHGHDEWMNDWLIDSIGWWTTSRGINQNVFLSPENIWNKMADDRLVPVNELPKIVKQEEELFIIAGFPLRFLFRK